MWLNFNNSLGFLQVWAHQPRRHKRRDSSVLGEYITLLCKFVPVSHSSCCLLQRKTTSQTFLHKLWVFIWIFMTVADLLQESYFAPPHQKFFQFLLDNLFMLSLLFMISSVPVDSDPVHCIDRSASGVPCGTTNIFLWTDACVKEEPPCLLQTMAACIPKCSSLGFFIHRGETKSCLYYCHRKLVFT